MKKNTINFLAHKAIGLISLSLGIHFMVSHFNKVFPFEMGFENTAVMFVWAYTGTFIGAGLIAYGLIQLFHKTVNKFIRMLEKGKI